MLSIGAVERDTGLSKDLLRVWERRYAFPKPARDAHGERIYAPEQVEKLRLIRRLMDRGLRPGKLIACPIEELQAMSKGAHGGADPVVATPELAALLGLLRSHAVEQLRGALGQAAARQGLANFVVGTVAPLNQLVGDAWMRGEIEVFEEHLYSEVLQVVLRQAIAGLPRIGETPRVLLTTLPGETHGLGLLMAEAMLTLESARCVSLGVQTPVRDIARAAASQRSQVVALSFSASFPAGQIAAGLVELREQLPDEVEIWAGGSAAGLDRRSAAAVRIIHSLEALHAEVGGWRERHSGLLGSA